MAVNLTEVRALFENGFARLYSAELKTNPNVPDVFKTVDFQDDVFAFIILSCLQHWRVGTVNARDTASAIALTMLEKKFGRVPTTADREWLRNHWLKMVDESSNGEIG